MATCEKCNATFTPSTDATEVTSTRILCLKCEAERRAERLKRAAAGSAAPAQASARSTPAAGGAGTGSGAARASVARDGVPPVPAKKRAPEASAPPTAPSSTTPRNASASPAPTNNAAARSRASAAAANAASDAAPTDASSALAGRASSVPASRAPGNAAAARPVASSGASARSVRATPAAAAHEPRHKPIPGAKGAAAPVHPDVRREAEMLRARANRTMTYAWIACGVLAVVAAGFVVRIKMKKAEEQAAIDAEAKKESDFLAKMKGFNVDDPVQADEAIKLAEGEKWWKDTPVAGDVSTILNKGHSVIDLAKDKKEIEDRLVNAESVVKDYATKSADEIAKVRRTLEDLEGKGDMMGDDFKKRVTSARTTVDRAYITRLHDEAKTQAAAGAGNARIALTAYTKAEDETLKLFEKNIRSKNKEAEDYFKAHYLDIIKESDVIAKSLFTPEEIAKTPWTDLLSADQKKHWQQDGFKGWRIENGVLEAAGPDAGSGKVALMAIPDAGGYRDFQLECEFTILKGGAKFCYRLGRRVDRQTAQYDVDAGPKSTSFKAGEAYTQTTTFVGSKLNVAFTPGDIQPYEEEVRWDITRKGAFGLTLGEGSEIKVTRLRIRELRSDH
jgi:hypothetical protein